jgi:hypothetical protein
VSATTDQRIVFVVGSGRSGTHWAGYTLDAHPRIHTTVEDPKVFSLVTSAALDPARERKNLPRILRFYRRQLRRARPSHYADKSHPNLWLARPLAEAFGGRARFLAVERNPFGVAASSLKHKGVRAWHERWREFPVPNRFLGITHELAARYDELTPVQQFAHRWLSHHNEMQRLLTDLPGRILAIDYDAMIDDYDAGARQVFEFIGVEPVPVEMEVRSGSRDRWREELSSEEIAQIEEITGVSAE